MYIICYDIENDKIRRRISVILQGFGQRVQKSVFECELDEKALQRLKNQLEKSFDAGEEDSIRIYQICQTCKMKALGMGNLAVSFIEKDYIYL